MRRIVFISRLDADCSLGASFLCDIAPNLAENFADLQIFIVGGGSQYPEFCKKANKINRNINRQLIFAVGESLNPEKYFTKDSLFVGVSRAALEAMAHSLPVILLGNEGYLGLLDEKTVDFARKTNFTCRGMWKNTEENPKLSNVTADLTHTKIALLKEITRYFELSEIEKSRLAAFSYQTVKNGYTARDMAQKTLKIYENEIKKRQNPQKIAICGYYGHGNLGDEAILSVLQKEINKNLPNSKIAVIVGKNPFKIVRTILNSEVFIFGGGSLLQNSTSDASLFYYLSLIRAAKLFCGRTIMLANGIGPINNRLFSQKLLQKALKSTIDKFDFISVRDTKSKKYLESLLPERKITIFPDPALLLKIQQKKFQERSAKKNSLVYIPCACGLKNAKISAQLIAKLLKSEQNKLKCDLIIAVLNRHEDLSLAQKIATICKDARVVVPQNANELFSVLKKANTVISQRYHGTLFAAACSLPTVAISDDPKMFAICEDFSLFPCQQVKILKSEEIFESLFEKARIYYEKNTENIASKFEEKRNLSKKHLKNMLTNL